MIESVNITPGERILADDNPGRAILALKVVGLSDETLADLSGRSRATIITLLDRVRSTYRQANGSGPDSFKQTTAAVAAAMVSGDLTPDNLSNLSWAITALVNMPETTGEAKQASKRSVTVDVEALRAAVKQQQQQATDEPTDEPTDSDSPADSDSDES